MKKNILFLCTGNSCRSQMAEGWGRKVLGDRANIYSAGVETHGMNPYAVQAMAQNGVDISSNRSKEVSELQEINFDVVVTVCDHARETCPILPGVPRMIHHPFSDPPALAKEADSEDEAFGNYLRVCGEIRSWIEEHSENQVLVF